jgi:hypothetical protein
MDLKMKYNPSNRMVLYTYGQPRIGNEAISNKLFNLFNQNNYFRVVNYDDLVAHEPTLFYKHAGTEVWYFNKNYDGQYKICENRAGQPENSACSDSILFNDGFFSHFKYVGVEISKLCSKFQPVGTLLTSVEGEVSQNESFIQGKLLESAPKPQD